MFSPWPRLPMKRFLSSRSSSQQELQAVEDLRAERAAIALSVGLSWPPDRYTKQTRGRPSRQQLWERALQDHIMNRHQLQHPHLACRTWSGASLCASCTALDHHKSLKNILQPSSYHIVSLCRSALHQQKGECLDMSLSGNRP